MKFSLFRFCICLPIIVALLLAFYVYRNSAIQKRFENGVDNNRIALDYSQLATTFGLEKARSIVQAKADISNQLFTDGVNRVVQIVENNEQGEIEHIIALRTFEGQSGNWIGPAGMRVGSVDFTDEEILVNVFGQLEWESGRLSISETEKVPFSIAWGAGQKPSHGNLSSKIHRWAIHTNREVSD